MKEINQAVIDQWELENKNEILAVKRLGDIIGYGNMMSIASALWGLKLQESNIPASGGFIPTLSSDMKIKEARKAVEERERRMKSFKKILKNEL